MRNLLITDGGEVLELDERCRWYEPGMALVFCERCGGRAHEHVGVQWPDSSRKLPGMFRFEKVQIPWSDYGPGRTLNVPMLSHYLGEEYLEGLQDGRWAA